MGHQPLGKRALGKRRMAGQKEIEGATQPINVGPRIDVMAVDGLFRREVVGRSQHVLIILHRQRGAVVVGESRQPEVENFKHVLLIDEKIGRLDVAMDQPVGMGMAESIGRLADVIGGGEIIHPPAALYRLLQVAAVDKLHHQVMVIAVVVDVVGPHDVGMVQRGGGAGLAMESGKVGSVGNTVAGAGP